MPGVTSVTFLSLCAWFKKSGNDSQRVELKSRGMVTTQQKTSSEPLRINSADNSGPSFKQKCHYIAQGLSLKGQNDSTMDTDTDVVPHVKEYQLPSELDVNHIKGKDKVRCLEMPKQGGEINNQKIHSIETSIKNIELKIASLASMQTEVKKLSWEMRFLKSEFNKK